MKAQAKNKHFYSGLSGIALPVPKYKFPVAFRDTSRLAYYASLFSSLEVNSSFYRIPAPRTVEKWALSVPGNFKFTFKLFREVTHNKGLAFKEENIAAFFNSIDHVGDHKGCVLVQLPPGTDFSALPQLKLLLQCISAKNRSQHWKIAIEVRHKSWYCSQLYNLIDDANVALVIHDIPKSATPMIHQNSDVVYLRFHGPTGNYRDSYPESFLYEYAGYIREWISENKTVYAYFNNTMGDAYNNQLVLTRFVAEYA